MASDKPDPKADGKKAVTRKARSQAKSAGSRASRVKDKAVRLASNPLVAEIVAATLIAAAAALRDPRKARELAESAGDQLGEAGKQLADKGGPLWQLAMDVAKRSVDTFAGEGFEKPVKAKRRKSDPGTKKKKKKAKK